MAGIEGMLAVQQSFNGGEIGPLVAARIDQIRYQTGCKVMRNCYPLVQGPVTRRPGTQFLGKAKLDGVYIKLVPFIFSEDQARVLEFGPGYIRFWTDSGFITGGERASKDFTVSIKGSGGTEGQGWEYKTPGSHLFTAPVAGTYEIECVGGGGGAYLAHGTFGSECPSEQSQSFVAATGGGGGYARVSTFINSGVVVPVVVGGGGGGTRDVWLSGSGGAGGTTSAGSYCTASGGGGAYLAKGTATDFNGNSNVCYRADPGAGGGGTGGVVVNGGSGEKAIYNNDRSGGGAGNGGLGGYGRGGGLTDMVWAQYNGGGTPHSGGSGFCRIKFIG